MDVKSLINRLSKMDMDRIIYVNCGPEDSDNFKILTIITAPIDENGYISSDGTPAVILQSELSI